MSDRKVKISVSIFLPSCLQPGDQHSVRDFIETSRNVATIILDVYKVYKQKKRNFWKTTIFINFSDSLNFSSFALKDRKTFLLLDNFLKLSEI